MEKKAYLVVLIAVSVLASGLAGYLVISGHQGQQTASTTLATGGLVDAPVPKDVVTVMIHDKEGNLIVKQTTNNIITTAGAAYFCIQAGFCAGSATGAIENPTIAIVAATPTYWVQFVNGSAANANEPTPADCSVSSSNQLVGQTLGSGAATKCVINFGSAPAQYPSGGANNAVASLCVSATTCSGDLRASSGIVDSSVTSTYALATQLFAGCSPNSNGTSSVSGTCLNSQQTSVFSNNSNGKMVITGLGLYGGNNKAVVTGPAGPILVAEASLSPVVTLNPGDTIQVTWQITI
ncbi:hypothetical protein DYY67_1436 [Candidatus Nitrosotalea sp. TS]|uniref:hypothetical protein n=1 Tax=Candidatus Nitrosotalea sp. TS TaxID=2341020 RepID=UPI00140E69CA|nr:hypothetical protein [Candidatus Nitrosotalea sp. TS]NHI04061.1 hypothetical protein [Candidatus Nitrosotalea sp. TS]